MSIEAEAAVAELDAALDRVSVSAELADQLLAVVDLLDDSPTLRRGLTDPSTPNDRRQALARGLLESRVGADALGLVAEATGKRLSGSGLTGALERQAVRALLQIAQSDDVLDDVEDDLFRFSRLVEGDSGLRAAISDRTSPIERRQQLVGDLLRDRARPETVRLAQRAVAARDRNFARTIGGYVELAAAMRDRVIATVRVARPLDSEQQDRLERALAAQTGKKVALQVIVEPEVLGGIRVELGDEVIEGTVAGRLDEVRRRFS